MPEPAAAVQGAAPCSEEEATRLSNKLAKAAAGLFVEARSFNDLAFSLFRKVDSKKRGCIFPAEFFDMVRILLNLSPKAIRDSEIAGLWRWADKRATHLSTAAFLKLMKLGWRSGFLEEQQRRKKTMPTWDSSKLKGLVWEDRPKAEQPESSQENRSKQNQRPATARHAPRKAGLPEWDATCHRSDKHGSAWGDDTTRSARERSAEQVALREAERRGALESFRDARRSARGLALRGELCFV